MARSVRVANVLSCRLSGAEPRWRIMSAISVIDGSKRLAGGDARRAIIVFLRPARSVVQNGVTGVRFVARAGRKGRHRCGAEEVRAHGDANRRSCGFRNELADRRIAHRFRVDRQPQCRCFCFPSYQNGSVNLEVAID